MVTSSRGGLGRPFANLFTANLASSLGDGIARTAIPLLAARLTSDPFLVSVVAALALLPWLFFAIPAGILIDQGLGDKFLTDGQLQPEAFARACAQIGQPLQLRQHADYDHGYYFISTFMADHVRWHAERLKG